MQDSLIAHTETKTKCGESIRGISYDCTSKSKVNLNQTERIFSGLAGALLLTRNLGRFSLGAVAKLFAGGALLRRGVSGHCNMYEAMNVSSAKVSEQSQPGASQKALPIRLEMSVQVPPFEAYQLWRDPANQSWMMGHFAKVDSVSIDRAHWKLRSPIGWEWDALIVADSPGEFISWESLPGAGLPNEGTVRFVRTETGGTRLIIEGRFDPPSVLTLALLKLVGVTPESVTGKALRRFKNMTEMGRFKPSIKPEKMTKAAFEERRESIPAPA